VITSTGNAKIKWLRQLQSQANARREAGVFIVEGVRLLEEALAAGWQIREALHTEELSERAQALLASLKQRGVATTPVSPHVLKAASDTQTPQGILAVVEAHSLPLPEHPDFLLILDSLRDPGNLGTILRTAAAAGVQAVILTPGSVDPFSPKVVRAGMGAHFRLPVHNLDWGAIHAYCTAHALALYLAESGGGQVYSALDLRQPLAFIIGGEASGAGAQIQRLPVQPVHIPMPGASESLNAAVAAAVLIFEAVRQRARS
jgi:TrmH family RNA methyltransferase